MQIYQSTATKNQQSLIENDAYFDPEMTNYSRKIKSGLKSKPLRGSRKTPNKSNSTRDTKKADLSNSRNKENVNYINKNIINVGTASEQVKLNKQSISRQKTRNQLNDPNIFTASFTRKSSKNLKQTSHTLHTPNFESGSKLEKHNDESLLASLGPNKHILDASVLVDMISNLKKQKPKSKSKQRGSNYTRDLNKTRRQSFGIRDGSARRRNRHCRSFTINYSRNLAKRGYADRLFNAFSNTRSMTSCHDTIQNIAEAAEVKKLKLSV